MTALDKSFCNLVHFIHAILLQMVHYNQNIESKVRPHFVKPFLKVEIIVVLIKESTEKRLTIL